MDRRAFLVGGTVAAGGMASGPAYAQSFDDAWRESRVGDYRKSTVGDYIDIRDFGTVVSGGNITAAVQATIDHINTEAVSDPLTLRTIMIPNVGGRLTLGAVDWTVIPQFAGQLKILLSCNWLTLTETLHPPGGTLIEGLSVGQGNGGHFQQWEQGNFIVGNDATVDPVIQIGNDTDLGIIRVCLKNVVVSAYNTAVKIQRTSTCQFEKVVFRSGVDGYSPLWIDSTFWLNFIDCICLPYAGNYSVKITTTSPSSLNSGLILFRNVGMSSVGILFQPGSGAGNVGNIVCEDTIVEDNAAGSSMMVLDSSNGAIDGITFTRCGPADPLGTVYGIKTIGNNVAGIVMNEWELGPWHPDSTMASQVQMEEKIQGDGYSYPIMPAYAHNFSFQTPALIDKRLVTAPRAPQWVAGTPVNVPQDPSSWTAPDGGDTVTTGQLAPDGSTMAAKFTINTGGHTGLFYSGSHTLNVGDWIIAGAWLKKTSHTAADGNIGAGLNMTGWSVSSSGFQIGGFTTAQSQGGEIGVGFRNGQQKFLDSAWHWFCDPLKVIGVGTGTCNIVFLIRPATAGVWYAFNPCIQIIPASAGWDDRDVVNYARSLKGGWAPGAIAGDVGILDHQAFRAKKLTTPVGTSLTIASGVITTIGSYHRVDTEAAGATDDLDTISGGVDGMRLVIRAANSARTVVAKDATGNLQLAGDFSMDNAQDTLELIYDSALSAWLEIGRSNNGAK